MSKTLLDGVVFKNNNIVGIYSRAGGIAIIGALFQDSIASLQHSQKGIYDLVEIVNSHFCGNSAFYGGSILFFATPQNVSDVRVVVRNTTFADNVAVLGPAFYSFHYQSVIDHKEIYTVEPPKRGHFGNGTFVLSSEVVLFSEVV